MIKYCSHCEKCYENEVKKCPECGRKLEKIFAQEEREKIDKQNEDMVVIDTLIL